MKRLILGCMLFSGCSGLSTMSISEDHFLMAGSPEGIRAYNDGVVGHITETKANPEIKSGYWQNRDKETAVKVYQFQKGGKK